MKISAFVLFYS